MHLLKQISVILLFSLFLNVTNLFSINIQVIDSLETLLLLSSNDKKAELQLQLANEFTNSNPDKALELSKDALNYYNNNNDDYGILLATISIARVYQVQTGLKNAINQALKARKLAKLIGKDRELAESTLIIANCMRQLGEYKKSSAYCFEALEIYENNIDYYGICDALNAIGIIYYEQSEYDKALKYFTEALNASNRTNDKYKIGGIYNNIAVVFSSKDEKSKSIEYLNKAASINRNTEHNQWLGINYNNLADDYLDLNIPDSAFSYVQMAIDVNRKIQNYNNLAESYNVFAQYYQLLNDSSRYLYYLMKSFSIGKDQGLKKVIYNSSRSLNQYYFASGNIDSAYHYLSIQNATKDSLDKENSLLRLNRLELLYDLEKKEQEERIERQREVFIITLVIILLSFALIVFLLLLLRYRIKIKYSKLEKQKLQDELEFRNKELTTNVMSLMKKNEMLTEITKKLVEIENQAVKDDTKAAINKIAIDIENSTRDTIWEEFELRFKQVHIDFYERLARKFPDLTPNEQRLCAFLRLNMSSKDISELTGQSINALEKSRFRLRKKLGISGKETNLISFISQI